MTIRDKQAYADAAPDWACLDGCWGSTRISPSDVDGMVERRGFFLVIEAKRWATSVPAPQGRAFDAMLSARHPSGGSAFTVLVVYGADPAFTHMQVWPHPKIEATLEDVRAFGAAWFDRADSVEAAE